MQMSGGKRSGNSFGNFGFLRPLGVLRAFWSKALPKPWRVPQKQKFWSQSAGGSHKKEQTKSSGHWVAWQLKTLKLGIFAFFETRQRFGSKTLVFVETSQCFESILEQSVAKTTESPQKTKSFGAKTL